MDDPSSFPFRPSVPDPRREMAALKGALGSEYEIHRELGIGSMARVFLARDRALGRLVAIKVLLPGRARDETARSRFEREARASASLTHPNVVDVYRFGRLPDQTPYLVMRFVKGRTMEERLAAEGPLDETTVRVILRQVAAALAAAHARGIVHRAVSPNNILWDEERNEALLSDFGIAAILATSGQDVNHLTMEGQIPGSPRYQAPEQLLEEDVTEFADIFAFAVTAYELLTGEGPWDAATDGQLIDAKINRKPRDLETLRPGVDPALADLLRRCLARHPRHRPNARDLVRALEPVSVHRPDPMSEPADLSGLMRRRLPQVVLVAVGIGWGLMTLMDQLVDRDVLPSVFYRLTLAFAVSGVAASAVVAWFHGEEGDQRAPLLEYLILGGIGAVWLGLSVWILLVS